MTGRFRDRLHVVGRCAKEMLRALNLPSLQVRAGPLAEMRKKQIAETGWQEIEHCRQLIRTRTSFMSETSRDVFIDFLMEGGGFERAHS